MIVVIEGEQTKLLAALGLHRIDNEIVLRAEIDGRIYEIVCIDREGIVRDVSETSTLRPLDKIICKLDELGQ